MDYQFLLSICVPTFNRANYLHESLGQIQSELKNITSGSVEVYVSDNASTDQTKEVVIAAQENGLSVRYVRNTENLGSDANIAQCFNDALGKYVLIMGDDDLFVDGALEELVSHLRTSEYGLVCLRAFGFDTDFRTEMPLLNRQTTEYMNAGDYLAKVGHFVTLISACVINKSLLTGVDARQFCGGNLVQVHLCVMASLRAKKNLFVHHYQIAVKRNNSGGYDHSRVFVTNLLGILDSFIGKGLMANDVKKFENRLMLSYLPFYTFKMLNDVNGDLHEAKKNFAARFDGGWFYTLWLKPALYLPRPLALVWAALITVLGRLIDGDFLRGLFFLKTTLKSKFKLK
jgi:glycosyltransferase involved in cell wall biosynthesis